MKLLFPRITLLLAFILLHVINYAYTRVFYMDQELERASLVKEIVILNYTSKMDTLKHQDPVGIEKVIASMSYSFVGGSDSVLTYHPPHTGLVNFTAYYHIADKENFNPRVAEGYWPAVGDTVLVVFNAKNQISLFAECQTAHYKFWSPYHTSSWNTQFYASAPFEQDTSNVWNHNMWNDSQKKATASGYDFVSPFHCKIQRTLFWDYLAELAAGYRDFKLYFSYAGLGSNMGSKQPDFTVNGRNYIYTYDQNSFYGEKTLLPDTICIGQLRASSIDSIIAIAKQIEDTLIYRTSAVRSGGIHDIHITTPEISVKFTLHNASDPLAEQIVTILNSSICDPKQKLWLFKFLDD